MSRLRERLQRLRKSQQQSTAQPEAGQEAAAQPRIDSTQSTAWDLPGTVWCENEYGRFIKKTCTYPLDYKHGLFRLGELSSGVPGMHLSAKPHASRFQLEQIRSDQLLFLDTETTGLGSGTGNVPFMIGIAWKEANCFRIEQLFIRNPAEEAAMLHHLQEKLANFKAIVTYNGRSFDWPLIKSRYVMHRMRLQEPEAHIDLLHPSRSLWQTTLASCRLGEVEAQRLHFQRVDDISGSLAPTLYFQYLQEQNPLLVAGIFKHNEWDLLSLAALTIYFSQLLSGRLPWQQMMSFEELIRCGYWLDRLGCSELAEEAMSFAYENIDRAETISQLVELAAWHKKKQRWDSAVKLWKMACSTEADHECDASHAAPKLVNVDTLIELAKYYEHRSKNIEEALTYALLAREQVRMRMSWSRWNRKYAKLEQEIQARIARLQRKKKKSNHAQSMTFYFD